MSFLLNKHPLWEVARRGLAVLLVFTLVWSLSLDIGAHAAHAGQSHASHVTADATADAAVEHASGIIGSHHHDQHSGGSGSASDCDCCSASCVSLVILGNLPSIHPPVQPRGTQPRVDSAIPKGLAHSLYRPPIAIL